MVAGNTIVYVDGTRRNEDRPRYEIERASWRGDIDPENPTRIRWTRLPDHPGPPVYRGAATVVGNLVMFAGGTDNPYNYNGMGYDGVPAEPSARVFAFDVVANAWRDLPPLGAPSMDHRGIVAVGDRLVIVGGMRAGQRVVANVVTASVRRVVTGDGRR